MSYRSSNIQEGYGNTGSNRAARQADNCDEGSQQMSTAGSHDEYRSGSRGNAQRGGSGEATTGYYGEDSGSGSGSSSQSNTQRGYNRSDSGRDGVSGSNSTSRQRGGSEGYSTGQTGTGHGGSSSGNAGGRQTDRYGGSSTGYTGGSTMEQTGSYGSSSGGHTGGSAGGYTDSSDGHTGGSADGYRDSSGGYAGGSNEGHEGNASGSSRQRVSFSIRSSSASRSRGGSLSGGFSSRSTGGYSSRSSGGQQGFGSGFSGASGYGGSGGFSGGSSNGGQQGCVSAGSLGGFSNGGEGLLQAGEKETMQNLNFRLSVYMDKVKALEDSNLELEDKIRHWYDTRKPKKVDNSKYYQIIEDLKYKIMSATTDNNELTVEVGNARLAADDFRVKYESEVHMRQSVDSDIEGLRKVLDDLTLEKSSLESQVEILREEMASNKKNHEQEMKSLQEHTSDVSVQLDAAPGINILTILNHMRAQYEELAEDNRRKAEQEYNQKITELSNEISSSSAEIETGKSEVTELRRGMQTMEIDLQSQLAMKSSLESTLAETQGRYASKLAQIQQMVSNLEEKLSQVRNDMEKQSWENKLLLDIKTRLENEIEMYHRLLEGGSYSSSGSGNVSISGSGTGSSNGSGSGSSSAEWSSGQDGRYDSSSMTDPKKNRLVTTITEERVNGRLVSTKRDKIEQKM